MLPWPHAILVHHSCAFDGAWIVPIATPPSPSEPHSAALENAFFRSVFFAAMKKEIREDDLEASNLADGVGEVTKFFLPKSLPPLFPSSDQPPVERLASLDVFRGLTVLAMILVDYGGGFWWGINHAPWDGVTFADFVVPAFLFIVGVSVAFAFKTVKNRRHGTIKILLRFLKLFGLGLILQGGYLHNLNDLSYGVDIQHIRIMGVLQRIAIAYSIVALFEVFSQRGNILYANDSFFSILKVYSWHWVTVITIICLYAGLSYGLYVPDWRFQEPSHPNSVNLNGTATGNSSYLQVQCNVRGNVGPACNAVAFVDRTMLGISHLYRHPAYRRSKACSVNAPYDGPLPENAPTWCLAPFDPEGLLSSLPAVVTCFIGVHYGHILLLIKEEKTQLWQYSSTASMLILFGLVLDIGGMPLNKQLYSLSYTFVTGGAVALCFLVVYILVDLYKWRSLIAPFKFIGAHALMIYALFACGVLPKALQGFYWSSPQNNVIQIIINSMGV